MLVREHRWLSNGTIVQRKNPHHRMIFIESENINATCRNIEEIIGHPIEQLLIEAKRKATYEFIDHLLLSGVKTISRHVGARIIARAVTTLGGTMGYGKIKLGVVRRIHGRDDYVTFVVENPYSLPLFCGDMAGAVNAVDRREVAVSYTELSPGIFEITGRVSRDPVGPKDRLEGRRYAYRPGDLEIKRCAECGGPLYLSQYAWDVELGIITSRVSGHRKVIVGPAALEAVIDELVKEYGSVVSEAVVEAQRRFVTTDYYSLEEARSEEGLRRHLAMRGLGNLREMKWNGEQLTLRLENACLYLVLAGLVKGVYELATGKNAGIAWDMDAKGSFVAQARPAS